MKLVHALSLLAPAALVLTGPSGAARGLRIHPVPTPAPTGSSEPFLAEDPTGSAVLGWIETRGTSRALRIARFERGRWSAPSTVVESDSLAESWADPPALLVLDHARLVAAWTTKGGAGPEAQEVRMAWSLDGGRTWGRPVCPHRDGTPTEHGFVSLVADPRGARVLWLDGRKYARPSAVPGSGETSLRSAVVAIEGALSEESEVDGRVCDCCATSAARTTRGPIAAYRDRGAEEIRDISIARLENGRWSAAGSDVADGWKIDGCPVNGPALDAEGERVALAWFGMTGEKPRVRMGFSSDGGRSFRPPIRVDEGDPIGRVGVVLLDDGSALVSWIENERTGSSIRIRRARGSGPVQPSRVVARFGSARVKQVARLARFERGALVAWTEAGSSSRVRLARVSP